MVMMFWSYRVADWESWATSLRFINEEDEQARARAQRFGSLGGRSAYGGVTLRTGGASAPAAGAPPQMDPRDVRVDGICDKILAELRVAPQVVKELSSGVRTFLHGDYRADNLLFGPSLGADGVAAIDWQISGRGGPLYDVAYLICNSVPTPYRHQAVAF